MEIQEFELHGFRYRARIETEGEHPPSHGHFKYVESMQIFLNGKWHILDELVAISIAHAIKEYCTKDK